MISSVKDFGLGVVRLARAHVLRQEMAGLSADAQQAEGGLKGSQMAHGRP